MSDIATRVLITCPATGTRVSTMLRLRQTAFEALRGKYSFRCNQCGEIHGWEKEDAWLEGERQR